MLLVQLSILSDTDTRLIKAIMATREKSKRDPDKTVASQTVTLGTKF